MIFNLWLQVCLCLKQVPFILFLCAMRDFPTLVDALDYRGAGQYGNEFLRPSQSTRDRSRISRCSKSDLGARRLLSLKLKKGDRVALIAETSADSSKPFACQYAGLVAVPLAIPMGVGQRDSYTAKLERADRQLQPGGYHQQRRVDTAHRVGYGKHVGDAHPQRRGF